MPTSDPAGTRPATASPSQERLVDELLGWEAPRPRPDAGLARELDRILRDGLEPLVAELPQDERLILGKTALSALACEGRFLDLDGSFTWSPPIATGKLAHRAIEIDHATRRRLSPAAAVERVWTEVASAGDGLAAYLNGLDDVDAATLRHDVTQRLQDFRDTWPVLPEAVPLRTEQSLRYSVGRGAVALVGTPDLLLGDVRPDGRARMLVVDLKTGLRRPMTERQDLRFYALLATVKYGVPPFRWATYYVTEGDWDGEDLDAELLRIAARRAVAGAADALRLRFDPPAEDELRLVPGAYCRWCGRREDCPAAELD